MRPIISPATVIAVLIMASCSPKTPSNPADAGATGPGSRGARPAAQAGAANASAWTANGASACQNYITPELAKAVLGSDAGPAQRDSAISCHAGDIYISLKVQDTDSFRQQLPMIAGVHPMSGVGEAAYWNGADAVTAVSRGRSCLIGVLTGAVIHGDALGQKLGAVCNRLFALP
jgi:hypothetical protein